MKVEVETTAENTGEVNSEHSGRRGMLKGQESEVTGGKIHAEVPLSERFGYPTKPRSLTKGRASDTIECLNDEEARNNVSKAEIQSGGK